MPQTMKNGLLSASNGISCVKTYTIMFYILNVGMWDWHPLYCADNQSVFFVFIANFCVNTRPEKMEFC